MHINIQTIPHSEQRYPTVGDWTFDDNGDLTIRISAMPDPKYEFLIAVHELIEAGLCQHARVLQSDVDFFDFHYDGDDEAGDSPEAPYKRQHCIATGVERLLAAELKVDWATYEKDLDKLWSTTKARNSDNIEQS